MKFKGARAGLVLDGTVCNTGASAAGRLELPEGRDLAHTVSKLTAEWAEAWRNRRQAHYQMAKQSRADEFRSRWSQDSSQRLPHAPHEAPAPVPGVMTPVFQVRKLRTCLRLHPTPPTPRPPACRRRPSHRGAGPGRWVGSVPRLRGGRRGRGAARGRRARWNLSPGRRDAAAPGGRGAGCRDSGSAELPAAGARRALSEVSGVWAFGAGTPGRVGTAKDLARPWLRFGGCGVPVWGAGSVGVPWAGHHLSGLPFRYLEKWALTSAPGFRECRPEGGRYRLPPRSKPRNQTQEALQTTSRSPPFWWAWKRELGA